MSEATLEATDPEAYEATDEAWEEDARADAYRQARQRQIMRARQAQAAHGRAPSPPSRRPVRSEVRSLDLETKMALDSLRRRLHEANRLAYRNAWAAEASAAASQVLDSFEDNLAPHDWARALIRAAPTLLLSPGKPTKPGLQGFLFDPRVGGGAVIAAIFAIGHFRGAAKGVSSINVNPPLVSVKPGLSQPLSAAAVDQKGNDVPNAALTWASSDNAVAVVDPTTGKIVTCSVPAAATPGQSTVITVTDGTATGRVLVTVSSP